MDLPTKESHHRRNTRFKYGDYDAFTPWRKLLCYTQRPGVTKSIKRTYNRRARARERRQLKQADHD